MIDIRTLRIQAQLLSALSEVRLGKIKMKHLERILFSISDELEAYCDNSFPYEKQLNNAVVNLGQDIDDEVYYYWFVIGEQDINRDEETNIPEDVNDNLQKEFALKMCNLEKLIIRGKEEGEPITDNERIEWWKMQKKREREEFYKMNGYYEDDNIKI